MTTVPSLWWVRYTLLSQTPLLSDKMADAAGYLSRRLALWRSALVWQPQRCSRQPTPAAYQRLHERWHLLAPWALSRAHSTS